MEETRNLYGILVGKCEGNRRLGILDVDGGSIKLDLKDMRFEIVD
jgi:hypothetical protein